VERNVKERVVRELKAAVFDLDGVITDTALIHFRAWKETFDPILQAAEGGGFREFTHDDDYVPYVDGKPRYDGVASFLESREISLPRGVASDAPGKDTVCAVGNAKNKRFREIVSAGEIPVFESTIALVDALRERGVACGVASSSRNCTFVLEESGLISRFGSVVDGNVSRELGLEGKPQPDIFVVAAERIGATPDETVMFEDAYVGVEAGRNGRFGLVVGIARNGDVDGLRARGADVVVTDLAEISVEELFGQFA
jgi:beta-phosphoglucomutase family hydrolase